MRALLLPLCTALAACCFGQGFPTTAIHWPVPQGGLIYQGYPYGYLNVNGTADYSYSYGSQNWSTLDMNGDQLPDLVVAGEYNATVARIQDFSPASNPYWKVYLNNGNGFSTTATHWNVPVGGYYYQSAPYGFSQVNGQTSYSYDTGSQNWSTMDMDGDGRPDLVVTAEYNASVLRIQDFSPASNPYWKVYLNNGSGFSTTATHWNVPVGGLYYQGAPYGFSTASGQANYNYDTGSQNWTTMDMNNDGRPDLVVTGEYNAAVARIQDFSPASNPYWKVYFNNGSGFSTTATNWPVPQGGYVYQAAPYGYSVANGTSDYGYDHGSQNWTTMDVNGDHQPDLVVTGEYSAADQLIEDFSPSGSSHWKVYFGNGAGFSASATTWAVPHGGLIYQNYPYGYLTASGTTDYSYDHGSQNWSLIDMNADARPDLVVTGEYDAGDQLIEDFSPSGSSHWKIYYNTGTGFGTTAVNWSVPHGGLIYQNYPYGYLTASGTADYSYDHGSQNWVTMDINADHQPDLVIAGEYSATDQLIEDFSPSSSPYWKVYLSQGSTGIQEGTSNGVSLFPNPTAGAFTITAEGPLGLMQLFDLQGREVRRWNTGATRWEADVRDLPAGSYLLQVVDRTGHRVQERLIVQH